MLVITSYHLCQLFHDIRIKLDEIEYQKHIIKMESNYELKEIHIKNRTCYFFNALNKSKDFDFDNSLKDKNHTKKCSFIAFCTKL